MMMNASVESGRRVVSVGAEVRGRGSSVRVEADAVDEKLAHLHRTLKRIAKARAHLDLQEAEALREAQQLRLWRQFGHVSLADYMVQELGYSSHRAAEDRLRVANALPQLPEISKAIENGEINFSQARELVRVATPENEQAWLGKAKEMNVREVEQAVAGHAKGDLPEDPVDTRLVRKTIWLSVRPETEVLLRQVRQVLAKERGEKLDEDAALEALCRAYLSGSRTREDRSSAPRGCDPDSVPRGCDPDSVARRDPDSGSRGCDPDSGLRGVGSGSFVGDPGDPSTQLTMFDIAAPTRERACRSSRTRQLTAIDNTGARVADAVDTAWVESGVASEVIESDASSALVVSAANLVDSGAPRELVVSGAAPYRIAITVCSHCRRGWQHGGGAVEEMTLAAVGRAQCDAQWIGDLDSGVVERARQEISPETRRKVLHRDQGKCQVPGCGCFTNLDVHHIVHRLLGGTNELWNLVTLCEAHHLAHHEGTLRIWRVDGALTFRWEGKNRLSRISHQLATQKALCERNVSRDRVAEIMGRTIAHVGESHVSEEEWLVIALGYAEQSRGYGEG